MDLPAARNGDEPYLKVHPDFTAIFTSNPASGLYSDDIIGTARTSTWDIGAFEYLAGSPPVTTTGKKCHIHKEIYANLKSKSKEIDGIGINCMNDVPYFHLIKNFHRIYNEKSLVFFY